MIGNYITPKGEVKNVIMFDEINKMVCVEINGGNKWFHEHEYSAWVKEGEDIVSEEVSDVVEEVEEKITVKKKATPKKKDK